MKPLSFHDHTSRRGWISEGLLFVAKRRSLALETSVYPEVNSRSCHERSNRKGLNLPKPGVRYSFLGFPFMVSLRWVRRCQPRTRARQRPTPHPLSRPSTTSSGSARTHMCTGSSASCPRASPRPDAAPHPPSLAPRLPTEFIRQGIHFGFSLS